MSEPRVAFLGIDYDPLDLDTLSGRLAERDPAAPFAYLVTPNVDHVVRLHEMRDDDRDAVWTAYREADWCVCDSRILAAIAAREGIRLPVAPGSDLTVRLLETVVRAGDRIAVIGGKASTLAALGARFPGLTILHHVPPMGLRRNPDAMAAAAAFVAASRARFVFLAVGSPQQELLAHAIAARGDATGIGLCIGAAIEFVVGEQTRAPRWLQTLHLEWAFRLASDPARLWRRYLLTGPRVFALAWRARRDTGKGAEN